MKWEKQLSTKINTDYEEYKKERRNFKRIIKEEKYESQIKFEKKMKTVYKEDQKLLFGILRNLRQNSIKTLRNIKNKEVMIITEENNFIECWRE